MKRGIRYSPVAGSRSVSMAAVSAVFMAEFQAMFAMYMKRVSMGYGSPAQALRITVCIIPWAAIGASHENALSILVGRPAASTSKSSGPRGKPSGGPGMGRPASI